MELLGIIIGAISLLIAYLGYLRMQDQRLFFVMKPPWVRVGSIERSVRDSHVEKAQEKGEFSSTKALLRYFWNYPVTKVSQSYAEQSWAVKESLVLKGDLSGAREKPGLGCAILSVGFAIEVFGEAEANTRITQVVNWAMRKTAADPPTYSLTRYSFPKIPE